MTDDTDEARQVEAKLELLATITQMTLASVFKVVATRQQGPLTEEQREQLEKVRSDLRRTLAGIEKWQGERPDSDLDLERLETRVRRTLEALGDDPEKESEDAGSAEEANEEGTSEEGPSPA